MASQTTTGRSTRVTSYGASSRPVGGTGWETFAWWFTRVSGVGLVFLAIIHLIIMHVTNDVSATTYDFVATRYNNPFWRAYDLTLLTLALFHGLNGLRLITDDYIRSRGWRTTTQAVLFTTALTFWLLGTVTIITFHANQTITQTLLGMLGR